MEPTPDPTKDATPAKRQRSLFLKEQSVVIDLLKLQQQLDAIAEPAPQGERLRAVLVGKVPLLSALTMLRIGINSNIGPRPIGPLLQLWHQRFSKAEDVWPFTQHAVAFFRDQHSRIGLN